MAPPRIPSMATTERIRCFTFMPFFFRMNHDRGNAPASANKGLHSKEDAKSRIELPVFSDLRAVQVLIEGKAGLDGKLCVAKAELKSCDLDASKQIHALAAIPARIKHLRGCKSCIRYDTGFEMA